MDPIADVRAMFVPLPTPFDGKGNIDEPLFSDLVRYYVAKGANALYVGGAYGQGPAMTGEQRTRLLEIALESAPSSFPVIPDVGAVDPYTSRRLAKDASLLGARGLVFSTPFFYSDRSVEEIGLHLEMVDAVAKLPMIIVNLPNYHGYELSLVELKALTQRVPSVVGARSHVGGERALAEYLKQLGPAFKLFVAPPQLVPNGCPGQTGTINPQLSLVVEVGVAFFSAVDSGDAARAEELLTSICRYLERLDHVRPWFRAGFRESLRHIGFPVKQYPRWPVPSLPRRVASEYRSAIDEVLASL